MWLIEKQGRHFTIILKDTSAIFHWLLTYFTLGHSSHTCCWVIWNRPGPRDLVTISCLQLHFLVPFAGFITGLLCVNWKIIRKNIWGLFARSMLFKSNYLFEKIYQAWKQALLFFADCFDHAIFLKNIPSKTTPSLNGGWFTWEDFDRPSKY